MIVKRINQVEQNNVQVEGAKNVAIQLLIGSDSQAPNFYLRLFEVQPGGNTPFHAHSWEHEVYFLQGKGKINSDKGSFPVEQDHFALVNPNELHQFENTGDAPLKFLCIIPKDGK